jgi:hypothetical protein
MKAVPRARPLPSSLRTNRAPMKGCPYRFYYSPIFKYHELQTTRHFRRDRRHFRHRHLHHQSSPCHNGRRGCQSHSGLRRLYGQPPKNLQTRSYRTHTFPARQSYLQSWNGRTPTRTRYQRISIQLIHLPHANCGAIFSPINQSETTMIVATPEQITDRQHQQATMRVQTQHLLARLDRRMQAAIDRQDRCLISQLQAEQEFLSRQM